MSDDRLSEEGRQLSKPASNKLGIRSWVTDKFTGCPVPPTHGGRHPTLHIQEVTGLTNGRLAPSVRGSHTNWHFLQSGGRNPQSWKPGLGFEDFGMDKYLPFCRTPSSVFVFFVCGTRAKADKRQSPGQCYFTVGV